MSKTRVRFAMLALVSVGTVINYLDRTVLGIAAPMLSADLGLHAAVMGVVFSAFSWSYALAQIPGGLLLDRFGTRRVYWAAVSLWSTFTLVQAGVGGLKGLLACRLGLGLAEAPSYPANSRVVRAWFPQQERARANSVYSVGQYFGLAFLSPALFWVAGNWGWRALFLLAGLLGLAFGLVWRASYREPDEHTRVSAGELAYIRAGEPDAREAGAGAHGSGARGVAAQAPFSWRVFGQLLRKRQVLGASLGQFASNSTLVFFLTWFPTYLATERHMQLQKVGWMAMAPYVAASAGVLAGGWLSDWLLRRTGSATLARKLPVIVGLAMATTIVGANYAHDDLSVVLIMSFVFFGQGFCNLGWTLITDVAPARYVGLTGGLFNLFANLAGIVTPLVIGLIVGNTGSFVGGLLYVGAMALLGVVAYVFVLGEVRRVELDEPPPVAAAPAGG